MSAYTIQHIKPQLVFVQWHRNPTDNEAYTFINDLNEVLKAAHDRVYFISDLRKGRIMSVRVISQLGQLTQHENWGGSTAFSQNPISKLFVNNFRRMTPDNEKNTMYDQPEQAIAFLEGLCAGLTTDVQWNELIGSAAAT